MHKLHRLTVPAAVVALLISAGCASLRPPTQQPTAGAPSQTAATPGGPGTASGSPGATTGPAAGTVSCSYQPQGQPARPVDPPPSTDVEATGTVSYTLAMTEGDVTITMDRAKAPCTVNSFASLATQKYYDGTQCHRLVDSGLFVLQCGDPSGEGSGGPGYTFGDEVSQTQQYPAGSVAMANAGPDTNGSQFFLVYQDTELAPNYTVFGQMDAASIQVVAQMAAEGQDGSNPAGGGRPNNPSEIKTVTVG